MEDYRNFYITFPGHSKYKDDEIIVDSRVRSVVQKIEMTLFTNKGEFIADYDYGCDIEYYLWETNVPVEYIRSTIQTQFDKYIPELKEMNYTLEVYIQKGTLQDIMVIDIGIEDMKVMARFS
jgi:hypothetical protein